MLISYIVWIISLPGETLRRLGRTWNEYWNQFLGKILCYHRHSKDLTNPIRSKTEKDHARKRLLILGLMDASFEDVSVPNIDLSGERMLKMKLRKSRGKYGKLKICKLS